MKTNTKVYEINEIFNSISVAVKTSKIKITKSDTSDAKVIFKENKRCAYVLTIEEGTLKINHAKKKWFTYILPSFIVPEITIFIPFNNLGELKVECVTGKITISNMACNLLKIKNVTGKITISNMACNSLEIKKVTGRIDIENTIAKDKMNITTNTGTVNFNESDASEIFIKSKTGNIGGSLLSDKAFVVKCNTGKVNLPSTFGKQKCEVISKTGNICFEIKPKNNF